MKKLPFLFAVALASSSLGAEPFHALDLKPVLSEWPLPNLGTAWLLPQGKQVLDGVPFQIDGAFLLNATNSVQRLRPGRFKAEHIAVGQKFDQLHLLAACDFENKPGAAAAILRLQYADGSEQTLTIRSGEHVRTWATPWHTAPTNDSAQTNLRPVWVSQHSSAAQSDKFLRLFHVALNNPSPSNQVTELSLESPKTESGLLVAAITAATADAQPLPDTIALPKNPFPDLRSRSGELVAGLGMVKTIEGKPLAGARVRVMAVREFSVVDSNSATEDSAIGKEAITDSEGQFTLPPLPDNRLYRLLATADEYAIAWYRGLDPQSAPVEIRLKPLARPGKYAVHARLVGPEGGPVPWAVIETDGVGNGTGTSWGGTRGFPQELISGTNGDFTLSRDEPFTRVQTRIRAPGLAPLMIWLEPTNIVTVIPLGVGTLITGRVVKEGQPLAGLRLGICGTPRWSEVFAGHFDTKTDSNGVFSFAHVQTNTDWFLYGHMDSFKSQGALAPKSIQSRAHGETNELGDLEVQAALRLAGSVKLRDGGKLPKNLKINASSEQAWDSLNATVDKNGNFSLDGLYPGELRVSLENREWRLSNINRSLDLHNPWWLAGLLHSNKTDLLLIIEKGKAEYVSSSGGNGSLPQQDWPQHRPISGAEPSGPPPIILAGRVVDDKTGDPIKLCKMIPGYKPPGTPGMTPPKKPLLQQVLEPFSKKGVPFNEMPFWQHSHAQDSSNGVFQLEFLRLSSTPMLRVEAPGYEPAETEPINVNTSNLVVRLKQGQGPNGIVLLPNRQPAAGATVLYLTAREQCSLSGTSLGIYGQKEASKQTGADGKFAFPTRAHGMKLLVSHLSGWAEESVERGGTGLKLELQPWASIAGTLLTATNGPPAPGVELGLTMQHDWSRGDPIVNLQVKTRTDSQGNFFFPDVPPRRVEVSRIIPMSGNGWTYKSQTWLVPQAGITNNLGKVIYDTPPPPSLADQLKQKLGL